MAGFGAPAANPDWYSKGGRGIGSSQGQAQAAPAPRPQPMQSSPGMGSSGSGGSSGGMNADIIDKLFPKDGPSPEPLTNSAERNPQAERQNALLEATANGDMNAGRMIDLANKKSRDDTTGRILEAKRNAERLGQGGSGAEDMTSRKLAAAGQRNASGNAAAITVDRENARNDLRSKIISNAYSGDAATDAAKRTAIAQYESSANVELGKARNQIQRNGQLIDLLKDPVYGDDFSDGQGGNSPGSYQVGGNGFVSNRMF